MTIGRTGIRARSATLAVRRGVTLIEVLLTMSVLVVLVAILAPNVFSWKDVQKLKRSCDDVRAVLSGLRSRAQDEGRTIVFAYQPGTPNYEIFFADEATVSGETAEDRPDFDGAIFGSHKLTDGLTFTENGTRTVSATVSSDPTLEPVAGEENRVRFDAEGRCNDHSFDIREGNSSVTFTVRGSTGAVTVSDPHAASEIAAD